MLTNIYVLFNFKLLFISNTNFEKNVEKEIGKEKLTRPIASYESS